MKNQKKILLPLMLGPYSAHAISYGNSLSAILKLPLALLHCYSDKDYNRPFNFKDAEYSQGVKQMMADLYKDQTGKDPNQIEILSREGSVTQNVVALSRDVNLCILTSNPTQSKLSRFMGTRVSTIASLARCPVLIIPTNNDFCRWDKIWHIQRNPNEMELIQRRLHQLNVTPLSLESKSLQQTSFTSELWKIINSFVKEPKEELKKLIQEVYTREKIDLIILVSHAKDSFQKFIHDDQIQIIFSFNIPVLIFQSQLRKKRNT